MAIYNPDPDLCSQRRRGTVHASYPELAALLGEPHTKNINTEKVNAEFRGRLGDDQVVVWDWQGPVDVRSNAFWSIWTNSQGAMYRFQENLRKFKLYGAPPTSVFFHIDGKKYTFDGTMAELLSQFPTIGIKHG